MTIAGYNATFKLNGKLYYCAMDVTLDYIRVKWEHVVLWYLQFETFCFSKLKHKMPGITEKDAEHSTQSNGKGFVD